jgi:hypothetical protein
VEGAGVLAMVADIVIVVIGCNRAVVIERCVMISRIGFKFSIYIFNRNNSKKEKRKKKNVKKVYKSIVKVKYNII